MKKSIIILFSVISIYSFSQVKIGGVGPVTNTSVSLEFPDTENRGLVLPWGYAAADLTTLTDADYKKGIENAVPGTLVYDLTDYRVRLKVNGTGWTTLTDNVTAGSDGVGGTFNTTGTTGTDTTKNRTIQDNKTEKPNAKVIIAKVGTDPTTAAPGILVLEDKDKAMILPKVAIPHSKIVKPAAGMIVYDTTNKMLCVFNGTAWTFWKENTF